MGKNGICRRVFLSIYLFILIFQPQIIPINTIYILGVATIIMDACENNGKIKLNIIKQSGMMNLYKTFLLLACYIIIISALDLMLGGLSVLDNRLRCINQLLVLTGIEFVCISSFFRKCDRYGYDLNDVIIMLAFAGIMQGLCSISAYLVPQIRELFLRYNGEVFRNRYVLERRGYGFSNILLDTYGYGMGLIAGTVLLSKSFKVWHKWVAIFMCMVSIILNARTGVVVFAIAFGVYLFQSNTLPKFVLKSIFAVSILFLLWRFLLPVLVDRLVASPSITIRWVGQGIDEVFSVLNRNTSLNDATVLSSFAHTPDSLLNTMFGTGHNVYGIQETIGFHSDVGYINYLWEFGICGSAILAFALIRLFSRDFRVAAGSDKFIVVFFAISYVVVLFKGILIGYNPGVVVNYLMCFAMIYFTNKSNNAIVTN